MSRDPKDSIAPTPRERELMMLIARGMQNKNHRLRAQDLGEYGASAYRQHHAQIPAP